MQIRNTMPALRWAALGLIGAVVATAPQARAQERTTSGPAVRPGATGGKNEAKRENAVRVKGVVWQPTLPAALAAAAKARPEKPVVWFRVLGELEGFA